MRMVSATTRSDYLNERLVLDGTSMHVTEGNAGTRFTDMASSSMRASGFQFQSPGATSPSTQRTTTGLWGQGRPRWAR